MNEQLVSNLELADPLRGDKDTRAHDLVGQMAIAARHSAASRDASARMPWWKRRRAILPLGVPCVVALTGGAVLIPLSLSVDGTKVVPDAQIPIVYTTDTGNEVHCRYQIFFGEPGDRDADTLRLAAFMDGHDWTGIGQRIYEEAMANPFVPGRDGGMQYDTPHGRDEVSLARATSRAVEAEIPEYLRAALFSKEGTLYSSVTDCKGELH